MRMFRFDIRFEHYYTTKKQEFQLVSKKIIFVVLFFADNMGYNYVKTKRERMIRLNKKQIISALIALSMAPATVPVKADTARAAFDPQTVMWTNNKIETVLAQTGKYPDAAAVNPNASSKDSSGVQNPYGKPGEYLTEWAYSEFLWTHSYPVGNGRLAGMIAGGIDKEVIQLNEDTCWDGSPYGTLKNEKGETVTTVEGTRDAQTITTDDFTSGSVEDGWRYFRGADENGDPAEIGSADTLVGDEQWRSEYPEFASQSISNQALNIDNSAEADAVQDRWSMEKMVEETFLGSPTRQRAYKSFVEVYLDFGHKSENADNYIKSLDMNTGIVTVEYDYNGAHYKRENFISYPDQAAVTHIESDEELDFTAQLHTYHSEKAGYYKYEKLSDNEVKLTASITNGSKDNSEPATVNAIKFEARMLLDGDGAFSVSDDNTTVSVKGGKTADIYVVGATNYVDYLTLDSSKPGRDCDKYMNNIKSRTYNQIRERHVEDFSSEFSKTSLSLENTDGADFSDTPTEKRVRMDINGESGFLTGASSKTADANKNGVYSTYSKGDNELAALEFNYGKYLIISGSRDGRTAADSSEIDIQESQPLNLTGKWNAAFSASWNGKYTININTEMNYWAAQPLNIASSERPFIDTFAELAESGAVTAANQYGIYNERGDDSYQPGDPWVMHHNYDLWRGTQPIDNATAGLWPTGGAWLLEHAWQYYEFNKDTQYLAEVYPYMKGAAAFFTQFLVKDPVTGYLITAASCSPEQGGVQPGPAMDTQLIRNLYDRVRSAAEILGKTDEDKELLSKISEQMPSDYLADEEGKLAPNLIDDNGLIKEWARGDVSFDISERSGGEWTVTNPFTNENTEVYAHGASNSTNHRHCSHLWEIFPGTHLDPYSEDEAEQEIFKAYQKSVSARSTGSGQGWGLAWRINLNARALDGNSASAMLEQLFTTRTSPNLFDQHPNFQIDGNYGATSGIIEMLVQSHNDEIAILPALPDRWQTGEINGINTRENATVDIAWENGVPKTAVLHSRENGDLSIRSKYAEKAKVFDENGDEISTNLSEDKTLLTFAAEAGKTYTVKDFGTNTIETSVTYKAGDVTEFYASDNGSLPKLANSDTEVGYLYRRNGVKIGYAVKDVDFDGLTQLTLKMASVRTDSTYVSAVLDTVDGKQIAYQTITTGDNVLELSGADSISGKHKLWLLFEQVPYDGDSSDKYLGNAGDLIADYRKTVEPTATEPVQTSAPAQTTAPAETTVPKDGYTVNAAYFNENGKLTAELSGTGKAQLAAASYDKNGAMTAIDVKEIDKGGKIEMDLNKPENGSAKLFVWDGRTMKPLADVTAPSDHAPTAAPTEQPTSAPTAAPTPAPAESGVYIGTVSYDTVQDAVNAAAAAAPSSESERVYIDLYPGVYREQLTVNTPYITIRKKAGTDGEAKITWYYGLGSLYDSCNSDGYYDPSVIGDGEAHTPRDWGAALKVTNKATGFTAEGITIENSYNIYYTEEELTDITGVDPDPNNSDFHRLEWIKEQIENGKSDDEINAYLQSRQNIDYKGITASPRERCAALHCSADKAVFTDCRIISTQDTVGINDGRMYFKNCVIGGTTDYICGSATAVFDSCELYTNAGAGGESATITAPSNPAESDGYLFYNCRITGSKYAQSGNLGRPWSGVNAGASYINTTIENASDGGGLLISSSGWTSMSGTEPKDARFHEYGSVTADGKSVDTSSRPKQTLLNDWTMLRYNPLVFTQGNDGWDPAGLTSRYSGINTVLENTSIDTGDTETDVVTLPSAPAGYEFRWESASEFATVNEDGNSISLIRPAYGEAPINADIKLYVREADNTQIGAEKNIRFSIEPSADTENVFTVSGTVTLSVPSENDTNVTVFVKSGAAVIKTATITIPSGELSAEYTAENIPAGSYTVSAESSDTAYNIYTEEMSFTAGSGENITYDIDVRKMMLITNTIADFDTFAPSVNQAEGFSAEAYTASGDETANLGADNSVYRLTKSEGVTVPSSAGISFDLNELLSEGTSLENTKTLSFSFDMLMETIDYLPSDYSYFDLASSADNGGNDKEDQTRFVRCGVHNGWKQLNFFTAANNRVNGDNTQFNKNNEMANRWYRIRTDIDLVTKTITTTVYDRDKDMQILNGKPFVIAAPDEDGNNINYPTSAALDNLYFNIYMDKRGNTENKLEYYIDNISLEYSDYE